MTAIRNNTFFLSGSVLLITSVFAGAYFSQPLLFFVPFLLLLVLFFIQYPVLLFYTLLGSIPWSIEYNITEGLGTDLPDEPLMLLMAFIVIALLLFEENRRKKTQSLPLLLWLLIFTVAWSMITVIASTHFWYSAKFFLARSWYLLAFVGAPLILKGDKRLIKQSAIILFSSMLLVTCVGLYKHAALHFTFANINEAIAPFFRNHVNYSALLVFMVPLQIAIYKLDQNPKRRALLLFSVMVVLAALFLSYARGAWLALFAGLFSYWILKKGLLAKSFLLFLFIVTGFTAWLLQNDRYIKYAPKHDVTIFHEDFSEHLIATYKGKDVSTAERFYRWVAAAQMSTERLATGFGPTTFYQHYKSYTVPAFRTWVSDNREQSTVHNYFLLILVEQGLPGLFFFLLLFGAMFWYAQSIYRRTTDPFWKTTVAAIAAILWMQCTLNFLSDLIETDKVGSVFYLCVSFLIIADAKTREGAEEIK